MKRMKKSLSIIFAILLLVQVLTIGAAATGEAQLSVITPTSAQRPGDEFDVSVHLENNPHIVIFSIFLRYDATRFEFVSVANGPVVVGQTLMSTDGVFEGYRAVRVTNGFRMTPFTSDGVLYTVRFRVRSDAPAGEAVFSLSYREGDIIGEPIQPGNLPNNFAPATVAGSLTIILAGCIDCEDCGCDDCGFECGVCCDCIDCKVCGCDDCGFECGVCCDCIDCKICGCDDCGFECGDCPKCDISDAPTASISAPRKLIVSGITSLTYDINVGDVSAANFFEIRVQFDEVRLEYVGATIDAAFTGVLTFLGEPTYNPATGEFFARLALLQIGSTVDIEDKAQILSVNFLLRDTVENEDRLLGEISSLRITMRQPGEPHSTIVYANLDPADATTRLLTYMRFDINRDGKLDIADLGDIIFYLYLRQSGSDAWIEWSGWKFDINKDGIIDIVDLMYIISYFN